MRLNRRDFLRAGLGSFAYLATTSTVPLWMARSAHGLSAGIPEDRIFVLVQLSGGNDSLNMVIPYQDDLYNGNSLRPNTKITQGYHALGDGLNALHPRMGALANWYFEGYASVLQNVGYPNANGSHFLSTSFYEYGASPGSAQPAAGQGWISRFFDNECSGMSADSIDPLSIFATNTTELPESLRGSDFYIPPSANDLGSFNIRALTDIRGRYLSLLHRLAVPSSDLDYVQRIENVAEGAVETFQRASDVPDLRPYPGGSLGNGLSNVSRVIRSGADTKIFYVSQGGYDTHSNQVAGDANNGAHANLLTEFSGAIDAFLQDMRDIGRLDNTLLLTFSEFGRRVEENGSMGTDHGGAGAIMAFGGGAESGVYGGQPELGEDGLNKGNLSHTIDFRSVYARVIEDWFGGEAAPVFGADYNDPVLDIQGGMELANFVHTGGPRQNPDRPDDPGGGGGFGGTGCA